MHCLASVMVYDDMVTGRKSKILGYMSRGDRVPDVMTTLWKRSKTGLMAMDASMQLKCRMGLEMVGVRSSKGSIIKVKPLEKKNQLTFDLREFTAANLWCMC